MALIHERLNRDEGVEQLDFREYAETLARELFHSYHAFAKSGAGEILVTLACDQNHVVKMTVSDDGAGLPPGFDWQQSPSLGLRIVDILSRQLDGVVEQIRGKGTTFSLTFGRDSAQQDPRLPPAMERAVRSKSLASSAS